MVDHLEQLFFGPGGPAGGIEVIEDKEGRVADLFEKLVEAKVIAAGVVAGAEMVQQVRDNHVERRAAKLDAPVGQGGREVCLAAPRRPGEDEPALGGLGVLPDGIERNPEPVAFAETSGRDKVIEREAPECANVADPLQAGAADTFFFDEDALARLRPAKAGMVTG